MKRKALGLFCLALLIRLFYVFLSSQGPDEIHKDAYEYHTYAVQLLNNHTYINDQGERAARMPGYPLFLALGYLVFGQSVLGIQILQCLLGAVTVVLLFHICRRFCTDTWAFVMGVVAACYFDLFTGTARVLTETLYIFFLTLFLAAWFTEKKDTWRRPLVMGLSLGLAYWTRPESLLFIGLGGLFLLEKPFKTSLPRLAVFWLVAGLFVGAWTLRNAQVVNAPVLTTTRAGMGAYVGLYLHRDRLGLSDKMDEFKPLSESEVENDRLYKEKVNEAYKNISVPLLLKSYIFNALVLVYPFRPAYDWTLVALLPFWMYGLFVVVKSRQREPMLLFVFWFFSCLVYVTFGGTVARYREPLAPFLILLAAVACADLMKRIHPPLFKKAAGAWVGLQLVIWPLSPWIRSLLLRVRDLLW